MLERAARMGGLPESAMGLVRKTAFMLWGLGVGPQSSSRHASLLP